MAGSSIPRSRMELPEVHGDLINESAIGARIVCSGVGETDDSSLHVFLGYGEVDGDREGADAG